MSEDYGIKYEHMLKGIDSPVTPDLLHAYRNEPLVNIKTEQAFNKKEVFRSAYYYANGMKEWAKGAHNKISKRIINKIIEPHKEEWIIQKIKS